MIGLDWIEFDWIGLDFRCLKIHKRGLCILRGKIIRFKMSGRGRGKKNNPATRNVNKVGGDEGGACASLTPRPRYAAKAELKATNTEVEQHDLKENLNVSGTIDADLCGNCERAVEPDDDGLECEICRLWFHASCVNIPIEVYKFLVEEEAGEQMTWQCIPCKRGYKNIFQAIKTIGVNQEKLEERQTKLEQNVKEQMEELTKIVNSKADIEDVHTISEKVVDHTVLDVTQKVLDKMSIN